MKNAKEQNTVHQGGVFHMKRPRRKRDGVGIVISFT